MALTRLNAKRIIKSAGAKRVSDTAATALADEINRYAYSIAKKAVKLSAHARRKTVVKADIDLAK